MALISRKWRAQLADKLWAAFITLVFHGVRLLPARLASDIGDRISRRFGAAYNANSTRASFDNLRFIRPDYPETELAGAVDRMWGHVGRVQAETAVIDRMWASAEITVHNEAGIRHAMGEGRPILFVFAHLGNWELLAIVGQKLGVALNVVYEFLPERFELELALKARARLGYRLIPPNRSGVRQLLAALGRKEAVALAIDEFKDRNVIAPPFGRPRRSGTNAEFAAKLARRFDALVIPCYCLRTAPLAFTITLFDPLEHPAPAELEAMCEAWIRDHPEQWYMLPRMRL